MKVCYVILLCFLIGGCLIDAVAAKEKELDQQVQTIAKAVEEALDAHQADAKTAPEGADKKVTENEKETGLSDREKIIAVDVLKALTEHQADETTNDASEDDDKMDIPKDVALDTLGKVIEEADEEDGDELYDDVNGETDIKKRTKTHWWGRRRRRWLRAGCCVLKQWYCCIGKK